MKRRLYALIFCTVGSLNAMTPSTLLSQRRTLLTDRNTRSERDPQEDNHDLQQTKKVYAIVVELLKKQARDVKYIEIKEIPTNLTRDKRTGSLLALEISNYCLMEGFEVYLHSPFGLLTIATGDLKSHCDPLAIDRHNLQKSTLKIGTLSPSFDYGEHHLKYAIEGIIENPKL